MLGLVKKGFAHAVFAAAGWSFKGEVPKASKTVFIAAPHTSNWDFVLLVLCAWHFELRLQWLGKHTIFKKPFFHLDDHAPNRSSGAERVPLRHVPTNDDVQG